MKNEERNNKMTIIKCCTCNSIEEYHYHVKIHNSNDDIVYDGYASADGIVTFNILYSDVYKITVTPDEHTDPQFIANNYYLSPCLPCCLCFNFYKRCYSHVHRITLKLTDDNYKDLPIMKGEIILWPHHM